jgi:hypothetical protein
MNTVFTFLDENREYKKADLVAAFVDDNKKYVAYELEEEKNLKHDILHFALYDEVDGRVFIHKISDEEKEYAENKLLELMNE